MHGVDEFLQTMPLFKDLDKKQRALIARTVFERKFDAGDAIVREGEMGVGAFMIRKGKVAVTKEQDGREDEELATLGPGEIFGEIALLLDVPRTATVRAVEPTELLGLTAWNFRAELQKSAELSYQLLRIMARRLAEANKELAEQV
jgi:CRP/FNR family transcriptional regulator, cyclic AMP receptor protein